MRVLGKFAPSTESVSYRLLPNLLKNLSPGFDGQDLLNFRFLLRMPNWQAIGRNPIVTRSIACSRPRANSKASRS